MKPTPNKGKAWKQFPNCEWMIDRGGGESLPSRLGTHSSKQRIKKFCMLQKKRKAGEAKGKETKAIGGGGGGGPLPCPSS